MIHKFYIVFLFVAVTISHPIFAAQGDSYEPNNSISTAYPISVGDSVVKNAFTFGNDSILHDSSYFDVDYYKVILEAGKIVTITLLPWDNRCFYTDELVFALYDSSKSLVYNDYTRSCVDLPSELIGYNVSRSGTYYLKIANKGHWSTIGPPTKYGLSIHQRTSVAITVISPNGGESFSAGQVVSIKWQADSSIHCFGIYYSFNNGATWKLIMTTDSPADTYSWLAPPLKNATSRALIKVTAGHIENLYGISKGNFTIFQSPPDAYEPNHDFSSAYPVTIGDSVVKNAWIGEIDTSDTEGYIMGGNPLSNDTINDYYKITLESNKFTKISLSWVEGYGDAAASIQLYDALKNEIPLSSDLTCTITQSGTYYIVVSPVPYVYGKYNLSIHQSSGAINLISPGGGENYSTGQEVKVRWTADIMIKKVDLYYSGDAGTTWERIFGDLSNVSSDSQYCSWIVPPLKQYTDKALVRVQATVDNALFAVSKNTFTIQAVTSDAYEPNNDLASAYPIAIGDSVVKNATVYWLADVSYNSNDPASYVYSSYSNDYYKVSLSAGKLTTINMFPMEISSVCWCGRDCLNFGLYNDSTNGVAYAETGKLLKYYSTQSGIYYCKVMLESGGRFLNYAKYGLSIRSLTVLSTQKSELDTTAYRKNSLAPADLSQGIYKAHIVTDTTKLTIDLTTDAKCKLTVTTLVLSPDELALALNMKVIVKVISIFDNYNWTIKTADITIPYALSDLNGNPQNMLTAFWLNDTTNLWLPVSSTIDTVKHQITVHGGGWGTYGIFVKSNSASSLTAAMTARVNGIKMNYLPHTRSIAVQFSISNATNAELRMYDIQGKCVKSGHLAAGVGRSTFMWHLGALANGKYFLNVKAGKFYVKESIVILN